MDDLDPSVFDGDDVTRLLEVAVTEDLGPGGTYEGDVTSRVIPDAAPCRGEVVFREAGVLAGLPIVRRVLARIAPNARLEERARDGDRVAARQVVAVITGPAREVLAAERLLLNFLQRLSGTATATRRLVDAVAGTSARVLDTRKTTPGWRLIEKYAVRAGGGHNHRVGLYDQILLKDNHLAVLGGEAAIAEVVPLARAKAPPGTALELEVTTLDGALSAARAGADIVLLDNFDPPHLREAVEAVRADARARGARPPLLEASGGITLDTIRAFAETGVDRISTGSMTHSARSLDIALDFEIGGPA
ncbi:MAG: carboxylating nicotinate-nucleotide diphosphorylase [Planctomycetes bacterium]|nr:carboxylating nicotinate-nucleotide diphosphorylase [Planctomycetota bacterium]